MCSGCLGRILAHIENSSTEIHTVNPIFFIYFFTIRKKKRKKRGKKKKKKKLLLRRLSSYMIFNCSVVIAKPALTHTHIPATARDRASSSPLSQTVLYLAPPCRKWKRLTCGFAKGQSERSKIEVTYTELIYASC